LPPKKKHLRKQKDVRTIPKTKKKPHPHKNIGLQEEEARRKGKLFGK